MKGHAVRRARLELGVAAETLAEHAGVTPGVLEEWERLDLRVPREEARQVKLALYMLRSQKVMERSGLPECKWFEGLEAPPDPEVLEAHVCDCPVCQARDAYARKHGPRMPGAMGVLMTVMSPAVRLPGPLRSAYSGFLMVLLLTGIPIVLMFVLGLVTWDGEPVLGAGALLAVALVGGSAGGLVHHYTRPLRRLGSAGHYASWILTSYGYVAGLVAMGWVGVRVLAGTSLARDAWEILEMVRDPFGLTLTLIFGAIFGIAVGRGARETPDGLEPVDPAPESRPDPESGSREKGSTLSPLMIGSGVLVTLVLAGIYIFQPAQWSGLSRMLGTPNGSGTSGWVDPVTPEEARAAVPVLAAVADSLPDDPQAQYDYGVALAQAGEHEKALAPLSRAEELAPSDPSVANAYGWSLAALGRVDEAIPRFRRAVAAAPEYVGALYNLGFALATQGELDEAVATYRQAAEVDPDNPGVNTMLARLLAAQGEFEAAVRYIERAMSTEPVEALSEETYARVLLGLGRVDDALVHYRQAAALDPAQPWYWRELGRMAQMMGRNEEADQAFARLDSLVPGHFETYSEDRDLWDQARQALGEEQE